MLERNGYALALLFPLCAHVWCTTAVIVVTQQQIIAGTDRLGLVGRARASGTKTGATIGKTVLLKGRFVVSCVGLEQALSSPGHPIFTFEDIMKGVDSQLDDDATMDILLNLVEMESAHAFSRFSIESLMRKGTIKQDKTWNPPDHIIARYIVAGYENRIPTIVAIDYKLDWQSYKLVGPVRQVEFPKGGNTKSYFLAIGVHSALQEIGRPDSYATKRIAALIPAEFAKLTSDQPLTSAECVKIIRVLIGIEAEVEPSKVGMGATVVLIPNKGLGTIRDYGEFHDGAAPPKKRKPGANLSVNRDQKQPKRTSLSGNLSYVFSVLPDGLVWRGCRNPEKSQMFGKIVVNP